MENRPVPDIIIMYIRSPHQTRSCREKGNGEPPISLLRDRVECPPPLPLSTYLCQPSKFLEILYSVTHLPHHSSQESALRTCVRMTLTHSDPQ